MLSLLLPIIYLSFISLGLPDSLLGAAWPSAYEGLGVPVSYAGAVSMIIAIGTVISSLMSGRLIRRLGTWLVTSISVGMTALALFGFSMSGSFTALCLWAIPYGLGAGSVDAALNNYVALHYASRHMSWLHCFWGVGATVGPYVMGAAITSGAGWNGGYRIVGVIQIILTAILVFSMPLWKKSDGKADNARGRALKYGEILRMPGVWEVLAAFFCYCALEQTAGLWASSYMALARGVPAAEAASQAAMFYLGITAGRGICGFMTIRFSDRAMVRLGTALCFVGIALLMLPLGGYLPLAGFILIGLGCAPIYPSLLHATPASFGENASQSIIGLEMACAYIGTVAMPPLFGLLTRFTGIGLLPIYLIAILVTLALLARRSAQKVAAR